MLCKVDTRRNHPTERLLFWSRGTQSKQYDWFADFSATEKLNLIRIFSVRFWRNSMKNNRLSAARGKFRVVENRLNGQLCNSNYQDHDKNRAIDSSRYLASHFLNDCLRDIKYIVQDIECPVGVDCNFQWLKTLGFVDKNESTRHNV